MTMIARVADCLPLAASMQESEQVCSRALLVLRDIRITLYLLLIRGGGVRLTDL